MPWAKVPPHKKSPQGQQASEPKPYNCHLCRWGGQAGGCSTPELARVEWATDNMRFGWMDGRMDGWIDVGPIEEFGLICCEVNVFDNFVCRKAEKKQVHMEGIGTYPPPSPVKRVLTLQKNCSASSHPHQDVPSCWV